MTGRTYRYMTEEPLYPFGFGLSYSQFEYSDLALSADIINPGRSLPLRVTIQNTGDCTAVEVVQFYLSDLEASALVPIHKLVGFERVTLEPGQARTLEFTLTPEMMSFFDDDGQLVLEPGAFRLEVGGCSPGRRGQELGASSPRSQVFQVQ
jgi:beta-glucosidase